jgi:DNA-directed RNA polymerase specialized sigma24 family protein
MLGEQGLADGAVGEIELACGAEPAGARRGRELSRGGELSGEDVAERLGRWRPAVLREMRRRRLWRGASAAELEDQFQDVALVLWMRRFASNEHLLRALWTGLGFRARDFWKAARRRETLVGEFFDDVVGDDRSQCVEEEAVVAADRRLVEDCLSELGPRERAVYRVVRGEGLSRRAAARALGLGEAEVLRALYGAQRKIDRVAMLLVSGRLCARRGEAVRALARSQAEGVEVEQARAHLAHCRGCLLAFREYRATLSRDVAAVLPAPAVAVAGHAGGAIDRSVESWRGVARVVKHQLVSLAGRGPRTSGPTEAVLGGAGAGGMAVSAKVAVGLCVGVAAGGAGLCVQTLQVLPGSGGHATARVVRHRLPTRPLRVARPSEGQVDSAVSAGRADGSAVSGAVAGAGSVPAAAPPPAPEFFDASGGSSPAASRSGGSGSVGAGSAAASQPSPSASAASGSSSSAKPPAGGGGEFFGG